MKFDEFVEETLKTKDTAPACDPCKKTTITLPELTSVRLEDGRSNFTRSVSGRHRHCVIVVNDRGQAEYKWLNPSGLLSSIDGHLGATEEF